MRAYFHNAKNISRNLLFTNNAECIPYQDVPNLVSEIGTDSPIHEVPQALRQMVWHFGSTAARILTSSQQALFPLKEVGEMSPHRLCLAISVFLVACSLQAQTPIPRPSSPSGSPSVTAVSGESWLLHLGRSFDNTSMGKTGRLGPGPQADGTPVPTPVAAVASLGDEGALRGSDLYRLNCRGCHGEAGLGAPPEINSVINPVRATSVPLVLARVKNAGMDMSYGDAAKLAQQSKAAIMDRLHKGGENMPAFSHLSDAEIASLLAYRNSHRQLFSVGGYEPVIATGPKADQICAFARRYEDEVLLVAGARFPARIEFDPDWMGTEIPWPEPADRNIVWRDLLSGQIVECYSDVIAMERLLGGMPVVVLVPEREGDG